MGEAPEFLVEDCEDSMPNGLDLKIQGFHSIFTSSDKTYIIQETEDKSPLSTILISENSTGKLVNPIVLGTWPELSKGHSMIVLDAGRILVLKKNSSPDDSIWFLEVDTEFVRIQKKIIGNEVVAWSKGVVGDTDKPIVITGPSGVGKGTLIAKLMKEFPAMFGFSVSHTTRKPREREENGLHYHFTERNIMEEDIKKGKFLEFVHVHGNLYGTSIEAVEKVADSGKRCILDIDVQGARAVRASSLDATFIFICPPSLQELERRLRTRGTESQEQIEKRVLHASAELEQAKSPGLFDHFLVNDDLETCYSSLKELLGLVESFGRKEKTKAVAMPTDHDSLSKMGDKVVITTKVLEPDRTSAKMILDLSSLKGGAPARTRGLCLHSFDSASHNIIRV